MSKADNCPIKYGQQEAYDAFEWLRQHATTHGAVALCEWHRLALENKRLNAELAEIGRQAGDATEFVLAQKALEARVAELEMSIRIQRVAIDQFAEERDAARAEAEAMRKDAERYRWLREPQENSAVVFEDRDGNGCFTGVYYALVRDRKSTRLNSSH